MAQFSKVLSILLILAIFELIVSATSQMLIERRDSAPYEESRKFSPKYFGFINEDLSGKEAAQKKQHPTTTQMVNINKMGNQGNVDMVDKTIQSIFNTNFVPGLLHVFDESSSTTPTSIGGKLDPHITGCLNKDEIKGNKTYCSSLRNYPQTSHLEELIEKKFPNFEAVFGEDLMEPESFEDRFDADPSKECLCQSKRTVIYPQSGQNLQYEWFYIVNSDKFKQGIYIEECLNPYSSCGEHIGLSLPSSYETSCEQHYTYRTLIAYDGNKDAAFKESFRIPTSCKCVVTNISLMQGLNGYYR